VKLESFNSVISEKLFFVPDYQRAYAWRTEQRTDLLEDLDNLIQMKQSDPGLQHFTGTLVLKKTPYHGKSTVQDAGNLYTFFEVVDGQQRLTTVSILLWTILKALEAMDTDVEAQEAVRNNRKLVKLSSGQLRLTLNGATHDTYQTVVIEGLNLSADTPAAVNLKQAKADFAEWLTLRCRGLGDEDRKAVLLEYLMAITSNLGFLVYEVEHHHEVSVIFESMNARGRPLTQFELVKNLLMYLASRCQDFAIDDQLAQFSSQVNAAWHHIVSTLQEAEPGAEIDEDQYLRFAWVLFPLSVHEEGIDRTSNIHGAVKLASKSVAYVKDPKAWLTGFVTHLRSFIEDYRDIVFPTYSNSFQRVSTDRQELVERCSSINRIGREANLIPLLMAAYHNHASSAQSLLEVFRLVETFSFRLLVLGKYSNTGRSKAFSLAADIIGEQLDLNQVTKRLKVDLIQYYCPEAAVKKNLEDLSTNYYEWSGIRYFLFEYELDCARNQHLPVSWDAFFKVDKAKSIEHVLPQGDDTLSKVPSWAQTFSLDEWLVLRHSLGNLTLCHPDWNSSFGNKSFDDKRGTPASAAGSMVYYQSHYQGMRHIAQTWAVWNPRSIEERQEQLVAFALRRWRD